jgi:hypothetical protein
MSKQIHFLQPAAIDKFLVKQRSDDYDHDDLDTTYINWVYRYMSQGLRCYRFSTALHDLINANYFDEKLDLK